MDQLIRLNETNEQITLSARELHEFLEVTERFSSWFDRMLQFGFEDGKDFTGVKKFTLVNNGAERELQDYQVTIDMAKEMCMVTRNDKGKQARKYFLEVEKAWNSPEKIMERALSIAHQKVLALESKVDEMKPKALFADCVSSSDTSILIGELAKLISQNGVSIGQNRLFQWMRENGYLMSKGSSKNMPTQKSMDMGLMEIKERTITNPDGSLMITKTTKITGKGQVYFVNKLCVE